jgi:hypothetical protein
VNASQNTTAGAATTGAATTGTAATDAATTRTAVTGITGTGTDGTTRAAAWTSAAVLGAIGVLHAVWAFTPWPLDSAAQFADTVVGVGEDELPTPPMDFAVAGLLVAASGLVLGAAGATRRYGPSWVYSAGTWTVAGVLGVRGLGGLVTSGFELGRGTDSFRHWDLVLYSPLCVALGALTAHVALRTRRRTPGRGLRVGRLRSRA